MAIKRRIRTNYILSFHILQDVPVSKVFYSSGIVPRALISDREWKYAAGKLLPEEYKSGLFGHWAPTVFTHGISVHEFNKSNNSGFVTMLKYATCDILDLSKLFNGNLQNAITALSKAIILCTPGDRPISESLHMVYAATWLNRNPVYLSNVFTPPIPSSDYASVLTAENRICSLAQNTYTKLSFSPEYSAVFGEAECLALLGEKYSLQDIVMRVVSHISTVLPDLLQRRLDEEKFENRSVEIKPPQGVSNC